MQGENNQSQRSSSFENLNLSDQIYQQDEIEIQQEQKQNSEIKNSQQNQVVDSVDFDWEHLDKLDESFIKLQKNNQFNEKVLSVADLSSCQKKNNNQINNNDDDNNNNKQKDKSISNQFSFLNSSQKLQNQSQIQLDQEQMSDFSKILDELSVNHNQSNQEDSFINFENLNLSNLDINNKNSFLISLENSCLQNGQQQSFLVVQKINSQDFKWEYLAQQELQELSFTKKDDKIEIKIDLSKLFSNNSSQKKKMTQKQKKIRNKIRDLILKNQKVQEKYVPRRIYNQQNAQSLVKNQNKEKQEYNFNRNIEKQVEGANISHKAHKLLGNKHCVKYTKKSKVMDQDKTYIKIK